MQQFKLTDNYYHRKCYLEREQVPTQTVMREKMRALAPVYFKSMSPKLKVLAGLEPPMKGGGSDWYMPPKELLKGRAVLKPEQKNHLIKLGYNGIDFYGEGIVKAHRKALEEEKYRVLLENDINWKKTIDVTCRQHWEDISKEEATMNTLKIQQAFREFTALYASSMNNVESLLMDAAVKEIERVRQGAYRRMMDHYEHLLKRQAALLYDRYTERLAKRQARMKAEFIENLDKTRADLGNKLHDINVEKHVAIEKLRNFLECQNLACQVYVALKEREECKIELGQAQHEHKKKIKILREQIAMHDFELRLEIEKEKKRQEFNKTWKQKICHVVKKFQIFVEYCLHMIPEQSEFFINMEKLMLLQLSEASENPSVESIFELAEPKFNTPVPRPHPFYVFCDKGYKPQLDQQLCPKHCTSSASQLPVVVVNKRCIYAACDNFDVFTDKVSRYIQGHRGDDIDMKDDHEYKYDVPVKFTSSQQLLDLKLESSLMQVLQKELPNLNDVSVECCFCKIPYCFCSPLHASETLPVVKPKKEIKKDPSLHSIPSGSKINSRLVELKHEREPKWESYMEYVHPKKCVCAKTSKKHLFEHLPAYMRNMSKYEQPELPNYETCSLHTLKKLVDTAKRKRSPPPVLIKEESKTREMGIQYEDQQFQFICDCFSNEEIAKLFEALVKGSQIFNAEKLGRKCEVVDGAVSPVVQNASSFVMKRAFSLRNLLDNEPELEEIFKKEDCKYD